MKLLLDTHIFLWHVTGDDRLLLGFKEKILDPENEVFVSPISIWEAIVKSSLGKLSLPEEPETYLLELRIQHQFASLPLDERSVRHLRKLPSHHRDPFDRMLICQAMEHDLILVTLDEEIRKYPVNTLQKK